MPEGKPNESHWSLSNQSVIDREGSRGRKRGVGEKGGGESASESDA